MSKVLLSVVYQRQGTQIPSVNDQRAEHVTLNLPDDWGIPSASAVSFKPEVPAEKEPNNPKVVQYLPLHGDTGRLVGQLKTYIDATYSDPEQRKAHKDIIEQTVWGWRRTMQERATQEITAFTNTDARDALAV